MKKEQTEKVEKKETTAMVVKEKTSMSIVNADMGFENFTADDMVIPRLRLLQPMSDSVVAGDAKPGEFQDSLTLDNLGTQVEVVLLKMQNGAVMFADKDSGEEGVVCRSMNGIESMDGNKCSDCPYGEYHLKDWNGENPPKCSTTKDFTVVTRKSLSGEENRPMMLTFRRTSFKTGKSLATMAMFTGKHISATPYIMYSEKGKSAKGAHFVIKAKKSPTPLTEDEVQSALNWARVVRMADVKVHETVEEVGSEVVPEDSI